MRRPGWLDRPMSALVVRAAAAAAALRVKSHTHTHTHYTRLAATQKQVGHIEVFAGGAGRANRATRAGFLACWDVSAVDPHRNPAQPPADRPPHCVRSPPNEQFADSESRVCPPPASATRVQCATRVVVRRGRPNLSAGRIGADPSAPCVCDAASGQCIMTHTSAPGEHICVLLSTTTTSTSPRSHLCHLFRPFFSRKPPPPPRCCTSATNAICGSFFASGRAANKERQANNYIVIL